MQKLIFLIFLIPFVAVGQQPAFPGAEGSGQYTTGGRGGDVYIVDNLSDDKNHPQKGTLRWAINQNGKRTIVFHISGNIELKAPLKINSGHLTIAGQTAPGDGICIKNYAVSISANNVIIRYLRFRCGDECLMNDAQDALNCVRKKDIIIDHCSMSWSIDETGSFYDNENFTMQWCILSESLYNSGHHKGKHGYGGIWGGKSVSFHHNLLAHHTSRNPRFNGARYSTTPENEKADFRNNVIFNWGYQSGYGGEEGNYNMVNNYYKPGPATKKGKVQHRIYSLTQQFFNARFKPDTLRAGKYFISGNVMEGSVETTKNNWEYGIQSATSVQKELSKVNKPFLLAPVKTQTAEKAYNLVLANVGAILPKRDAVDQRIVREVKTGVCEFGDSYGKNSGIIDSQKSVGGWPELKSLEAPVDTDLDGMPDNWEKEHGFDLNNPSDGKKDSDKDGYTNLEEYLNSIGL